MEKSHCLIVVILSEAVYWSARLCIRPEQSKKSPQNGVHLENCFFFRFSVFGFITHFDHFGLFQVQQRLCCLSWSQSRRRGPVSEMRWRISGSTRDTPRNHSTLSPTKTGKDLLCLTRQRSARQLKLERVSRGNKQRHVILTVEFVHPVLMITRLCPEDLNSSVLTYMTETLGYSLSEITHTVTANKPSAIMASYHLLLNKLGRSQKGTKAAKVHASSSNIHAHLNPYTHQNTSIHNFFLRPATHMGVTLNCWTAENYVRLIETGEQQLDSSKQDYMERRE